jgi:DUF4097 and DUF4098 domain-containing protein YvlB
MQEERKRILQMVEEGKLSADEAIILLDSLEKSKESTELSTSVNWNESTSSANKKASKKGRFTYFIESAVQKMKDFDLDLNFGPAHDVDHIFQNKDVSLSKLDIDIANGEIKIIPWDEKDVRVECKAKVYKVNSQEEARRLFLDDVFFKIDDSKLTFSVQKKQIKVNACFYVPAEDYEVIRTRLFNGHIFSEKLQVKEFKAKSASGRINVKEIEGNKLELETVNGNIEISGCKGDKLEAETLNGAIQVHGSFETVDVQNISGNVTCDLLDTRTQYALLKTKAGAVSVILDEELEVDGQLKTNFGRFHNDLANVDILREKSEVVQKEQTFIANKGKEHRIQLEAESNAGSISLKYR